MTVAKSLLRHRALLVILTSRELKARYRGSMLGYLWSLVNPVLMLLVYTFVFSTIFQPRDASVDPYGLFLVTGLFPWIWIQTSWMEGAASLLANAGLIRKATFPTELLPVVPVLANLVHFLFALPVIALAFVVAAQLGYDVGGWTFILLPVIILLQLPLIAGLAVATAALQVHFKDVKDILANILQIGFFMTPILYKLDTLKGIPPVHALVAANPMTPYMLAYQESVFYGRVPKIELWIAMIAISGVTWWLSATLYERLRDTLVEAA
ncbi:MAG: ABC transporter permease [Acidobacteriota bacterium]